MFQVVNPVEVFFRFTCECHSVLTRSCYCPLFEEYSVECANNGLFAASIIPQFCQDRTVDPTSVDQTGSDATVSATPGPDVGTVDSTTPKTAVTRTKYISTASKGPVVLPTTPSPKVTIYNTALFSNSQIAFFNSLSELL